MTGVAIMGLHRGGTSAVAGVIHALGFYMGNDLLPPSEHNPKGYFESRKMMELHTAMMGGDVWDPKIDVQPHLDDYEEALASFEKHEPWAVKDPRFCYLLPYLQQYYDQLVVVLRSVEEAAQSLHVRGGHTSLEALKLIEEYESRMYESRNAFPRQVISVHYCELEQWPFTKTQALAGQLGVTFYASAANTIDPALRHWR